MSTELSLFLWATSPLYRRGKLGLNFGSESFQRSHGSKILSHLKQKNVSQVSLYSLVCIIRIYLESANSFVALQNTHRPIFVFTLTLKETWRKQLPTLCSIHELGKTFGTTTRSWGSGGIGNKTKANLCKCTLSPHTAILLQDVSHSSIAPLYLKSEPPFPRPSQNVLSDLVHHCHLSPLCLPHSTQIPVSLDTSILKMCRVCLSKEISYSWLSTCD